MKGDFVMKKYPLATIGGLGLVAAIFLLLNINTRPIAGDISSPATGAALVEGAERHFGGLDKFDSGTRWPSFTTQGGGR
jgi:hypothetical protein